MKKLLCLVLLSLLLLTVSALGEEYAVVIGTSSLNIRSGPSASYSWLGSVKPGGWVEVVGESGNWYQICTMDGTISGFMSKNYLETAIAGGNTYVVNNPGSSGYLNLRAQPSYTSAVLDIFYNGQLCNVLEKRSDGWYYVTLSLNGSSRFGYFRSEFLTPVSGSSSSAPTTAVVKTPNGGWLNIRSAPSMYAAVPSTIPNGATVSVLLKGTEFCFITYNGQSGFVGSSYLNYGGGGGSGILTATVQTGNSGKLNMRDQASTQGAVIGRYSNGTVVSVLQKGSDWSFINVNGVKGYVMTKYLHFGSSPSYGTTKTVYNTNGGTYVNLRTTPQQVDGNVSIRVPNGAIVNVLSWGTDWSRVSFNGTTGYMMSWFLK